MRPDDDSFTGLDHAQRGRTPRGGAIYHLRVRTASRSKGQSARAACAYIERSAEYGRAADVSAELVYTESGHMPGWAEAEAGGAAYWDAADLYERSNGRLYKSMDFALPLALDADQQRELAVGFAHSLTDAEQLPYTLAIHAGKGANPHCHLMISERTNDDIERSAAHWFKRYNAAEPEHGGARKSTALHPKDWLLETRAAWAEQSNAALREAGLEIQIDHRSLEAQGIARVPGIHLGPHVLEMEARGIQTERGQLALGISQTNEQIRAREEGREYGRDRQSEESPRAVHPSPRHPSTPEPEPGDRSVERGARGVAGPAAELTEPDGHLAAGHQRAPSRRLPDGPAAGRGAAADRGGGVEARAGRIGPGDARGAQFAQRLGVHAEQPSRGAGEPQREVDLGPEPGAVGRDSNGSVAQRGAGLGRGAALPEVRPAAPGVDAVGGRSEESLELSPEMGRGEAGRPEAGREASRGQEGRRVAAAADLATARAQLAAAEAAMERGAAQLTDAAERLERQAEEQRELEAQRQQEAKRLEREAELENDGPDLEY